MDRRLLGVDYGTKRIGIALSDAGGHFSSPHTVIVNDDAAVQNTIRIAKDNQVIQIVIGQSVDYRGQPNPIFDQAKKFGDALASRLAVPVVYEDETLSSKEAERIIGRDDSYDARAAAIILKNFIDRKKYD